MDDKDKSDPITESSWTISTELDGVYYSSVFGEFGWSLTEHDGAQFTGRHNRSRIEVEQTCNLDETGVQASGSELTSGSVRSGDVLMSNPSVSTSSGEDRPEKSVDEPPETPGKVKKKGQKRMSQPRFAFMTKSDIDHLEDGYRWRKYGQKAVKNSPFPRSYYRCTNSKCTVKKRVERSSEDPTIVVTTYEGQHCHHTVGFLRGGILSHEAEFPGQLTTPISQFYYHGAQQTQENTFSVTHSQQLPPNEARESVVFSEADQQLPADDGLLGDIVPPGMRNR